MPKQVERLEQVTIRFAGDSGDGMQLTGGRFTSETAMYTHGITFGGHPVGCAIATGSAAGTPGAWASTGEVPSAAAIAPTRAAGTQAVRGPNLRADLLLFITSFLKPIRVRINAREPEPMGSQYRLFLQCCRSPPEHSGYDPGA
jgi:hypothetical protein